MSLEELSQTTRIPLRSLQLLEEGRIDVLPGEVFVRGFVKAYARAVGVPVEEAVRRYEESCRPSRNPALNAALPVGASDGGRRFGLAIALAILLILFTLALSIVLRPRHRDAPVELSLGVVPVLVGGTATPASAPEEAASASAARGASREEALG